MQSPNTERAIADSGCTDHYASIDADVENIKPAGHDAVTVTLPNGTNITSTHVATLKTTKLPAKARTCHLFQHMKHKILLSLGKLCDCDMHIILTKTEILVCDNKSNKLVMKGDRTNTDKMWYLQIVNEDHQQHDAQ